TPNSCARAIAACSLEPAPSGAHSTPKPVSPSASAPKCAQPFPLSRHPAEMCYKNRMTKQEIILASQRYLFPSVFHYFKEPLVIERAKDQFVCDTDGNQYLDFFGGIVTISVGHCNETVNKKVSEQMAKL